MKKLTIFVLTWLIIAGLVGCHCFIYTGNHDNTPSVCCSVSLAPSYVDWWFDGVIIALVLGWFIGTK